MLYNVPQEKKADCVLAGIVVLTTRGCLLDMLISVASRRVWREMWGYPEPDDLTVLGLVDGIVS